MENYQLAIPHCDREHGGNFSKDKTGNQAAIPDYYNKANETDKEARDFIDMFLTKPDNQPVVQNNADVAHEPLVSIPEEQKSNTVYPGPRSVTQEVEKKKKRENRFFFRVRQWNTHGLCPCTGAHSLLAEDWRNIARATAEFTANIYSHAA